MAQGHTVPVDDGPNIVYDAAMLCYTLLQCHLNLNKKLSNMCTQKKKLRMPNI